jgi:hypothetical protein
VFTLPTLIRYSTRIPCQSSKAKETNKWDSNREKVKLSLLADDMILYLKVPEDSIKNPSKYDKHFWKCSRIEINKN